IEGGKARNIVPDRCTIKCEARSRNESKLMEQVEHMRRTFEYEAARIGARAQVDTVREYSAFRFTEADEVVRVAAEAARRIGIEPVLQDGGGGSDANVFNAAGIPSVVLGVGYHDPHTPSESIALDDLARAAMLVVALVEVAGEGKSRP
ncbi:MAG: M20/M25/M40 family metallo-hydrolase, partial [Armatimonadota bacterium]